VLEALAERPVSAIEATLVSLGPTQAYSGMVPGLIGGRYALPDLTFDLPAMCRRAGVTFLTGEVTRIESAPRRVLLQDGRAIEYDVLSTAAGSLVEGSDLPGVAEHALQVKPIGRVVEIVPDLERAAAQRDDPDVVLVGGGAAGIEIALAVRARLRILARPRANVTVVESGDVLFANKLPALESMARASRERRRVAARGPCRRGYRARRSSGVWPDIGRRHRRVGYRRGGAGPVSGQRPQVGFRRVSPGERPPAVARRPDDLCRR
jgi:NADH dehydrogenase FAD-containing subunit